MENNTKLLLAQRTGSRCSRCGRIMAPQQFELHHIKPVSDGGVTDISNLVLLCPNCHREIHTSENSRLAGAGIGGAVLGASLAGPVGAIIGGIVGLLMGDSVNKAKRGETNG